MFRLTMLFVLALGVSGAAGAPLPGAQTQVARAQLERCPDDTVRLHVEGADAEMILLRLGVDPASIQREAGAIVASLSQGQRAALSRIDSLQLR